MTEPINDAKYYLAGWACASGTIVENNVDISAHTREGFNKLWQHCVKSDINSSMGKRDKSNKKTHHLILGVDISADILIYMQSSWTDALFQNEDNFNSFVRGYFHANGYLSWTIDLKPLCSIWFDTTALERLQYIANRMKIPFDEKFGQLQYVGVNAIDFAGKILKHDDDFYKWANMQTFPKPTCVIRRTDTNAVVPNKTHASDVGYDVTIIKEHKRLGNRVIMYDTGLQLTVSQGFYAELVPRSSLSKTGYMLANSMGIIDPGYKNNLYVAVIQVDPDAPPLPLPFRGFQLIFRQHARVHIYEDDPMVDIETSRGMGGFGSTSIVNE